MRAPNEYMYYNTNTQMIHKIYTIRVAQSAARM